MIDFKNKPKNLWVFYFVFAIMSFAGGAVSGSDFYNGLGVGIGISLLLFAAIDLATSKTNNK